MREQKQQAEAADGQSALTAGLCMDLPLGWTFEPLHRRCPKCGWDLRKNPVPAENDKSYTQNIECNANKPGVSRVPENNTNGVKSGLQWMVGPLPKTNPENPKRNKRGWHYRERLKKTGPRKNKDENANNHEHLIPVIKRDFGKRIIQWLLRAVA